MKTVKIGKKEMKELTEKVQTHQIISGHCMNDDCDGGTVIVKEYETRTERHVFHVCTECGNTKQINNI